MKIRRTPIAMTLAAISLGLLAACSDEADQVDQAAEAPVEQVTPPAANTPADSVPPPAAAPDTGTTMPPPVEETSPSSGTGAGSSMDTAPAGSTPGTSTSGG